MPTLELKLTPNRRIDSKKTPTRGTQLRCNLDLVARNIRFEDLGHDFAALLSREYSANGDPVPETLTIAFSIEGCLCWRDSHGNLRFSPPKHHIRNPRGKTQPYELVRLSVDTERWLTALIRGTKWDARIGEDSSYYVKTQTAEALKEFIAEGYEMEIGGDV